MRPNAALTKSPTEGGNMAVHQGKAAVRKSQFAATRSKPIAQVHRGTRGSALARRRRRGGQFHRFQEAVGKIVEFVEMYTSAEFPCVEIGFTDKTALHFLMETRLTMEPTYSDWTTGDQRRLRQWPVQEAN